MGDFIAIDTFSIPTIPSLGIYPLDDFEDLPGSKDDRDDLVSTLHAMSFRDFDIPTPPSPPEVTLTLPHDWDCRTASDVAQRLAGSTLYTPTYGCKTALRLESKCKKIIPYLHHDILRHHLPTFSTINPSGKPHRLTFTERRKLKALEYLYARRLQVAHLDAVKRASPAMWGYLTQLTAAINYDYQLWARVHAVRQPLDPHHLTLSFPPGWWCHTVEDVVNHLTDSPIGSDTTPGASPTKIQHQLSNTQPLIYRDRLPIFSKDRIATGAAGKLARLVRHQLLALEWLYDDRLGVAHLNVIERECRPLFEYIGDLARVVEEHKDQDAPTIEAALEGFTLANRNTHSTPHNHATSSRERPALTCAQLEGVFETNVDFKSEAAAGTLSPSAGAKRKLCVSSSAPDSFTRDHSPSESLSSTKRPRQNW